MKPYVICHMMSSVDGHILPDRWHPLVEDRGLYERLHNELGCDAWLEGGFVWLRYRFAWHA